MRMKRLAEERDAQVLVVAVLTADISIVPIDLAYEVGGPYSAIA